MTQLLKNLAPLPPPAPDQHHPEHPTPVCSSQTLIKLEVNGKRHGCEIFAAHSDSARNTYGRDKPGALQSVGRTTRASSLGGVTRRCHDGYTGCGNQPRGPLIESRGARSSTVRAGKFGQIPPIPVELRTRQHHAHHADRCFDGAATCTGETHGGDDVVGHNPIQARPRSGRCRSARPLSYLRWSKRWFSITECTERRMDELSVLMRE
jgi:hypothetical protein